MAATQGKNPLDVLQEMFNEVLVQTGKAIKASQKDGGRNGYIAGTALRTKMPETMKTYHYALDDLESEITRAKAVLLRDLEKLQRARAPVPVPSPVAPPAPMDSEPLQPAALMLEAPSAAAHTVKTNPSFQPIKEESKRAPFPDMGMGLSGDVDLTSTLRQPTPSPRPSAGQIKQTEQPRATPSIKQSPKPATAIKASPRPASQALPQPTTADFTAPKTVAPTQQASAQDNSLDAMLALPPTGGAATADMTGGELNFTNMEFSLAPAPDGQSQNAPPAPMQDFDLSAFTNSDGGADLLNLDDPNNGDASLNPAPTDAAPAETPGKAAENAASSNNIDSMYDLNNLENSDGMELDLNLGGDGQANDNSFNELFFEDNDEDMEQFDDAYFGLS